MVSTQGAAAAAAARERASVVRGTQHVAYVHVAAVPEPELVAVVVRVAHGKHLRR